MVLLYSIILVEDDSMQRSILKKMILSANEFVKIYEADSESSALEVINKHDINMFLIDISLKESSGLDLAVKIRNIPKYEFRQIIFLTTHMEYIIQAFKETHCYDYILKPYDKEKVQAMINKIIDNDTNNLIKEEVLKEEKKEEKEIVVNLKNGIYVGIKVDDIVFIEVRGKNCEINTVNGMYIASNMSLKKMLQLIDSNYIIQSHRAFIVNKNYILQIEKIDVKLSTIHFKNYSKTALLGYKFKDNVMSEFKKGKVVLC